MWIMAKKPTKNAKENYSVVKGLIVTSLLIFNVQFVTSYCYDSETKNLLGMALSESTYNSHGVKVVSEDGVKGYSFDETSIYFGVDTTRVFPRCSTLPDEFSIRVTFKSMEPRYSTQYIFTLLAQDRRTRLLSLRLKPSAVIFQYGSIRSGSRMIRFKNTRFSDGKWHTLIVTVTRSMVSFNLDCDISEQRTIDEFPNDILLTFTRIHVGNRKLKRERFTGAMNELILQNGYDLSRVTCRDRRLPKPVPNMDKDDSIVCKYTGEKIPMSKLSTCMTSKRPERLDYIEDFDDISTPGGTVSVDLEVFNISGEGTFLVTANNGSKSQLFQWDEESEGFLLYQELSARNPRDWTSITIGREVFLAAAIPHHGYEANSIIYRWNFKKKVFRRHQYIKTYGAVKWKAMEIEGEYFLAVANNAISVGGRNVASEVYRWNGEKFEWFQNIQTFGATDLEFLPYSIPGITVYLLLAANAFAPGSTRVQSTVYIWFENSFRVAQEIQTERPVDLELFTIKDVAYLAVASPVSISSSFDGSNNVEASLYELNIVLQQFQVTQRVLTQNVVDWEFFKIGRSMFLASANVMDGGGVTTTIYKWQGLEKFVPVHVLPTGSISDIEYLQIDSNHYLAMADPKSQRSRLYSLVTY